MLGKWAKQTVLLRESEPPELSARDALLLASVGVVERAGNPAVTLEEIASAAEVDIDVASALFGSENDPHSVDDLLVEAALRMCADDLRLDAIAKSTGAPTVSAYAHHFAARRRFYRAMRHGPVAELLDARMAEVMAPLISVQIRTLVGRKLTDEVLAALTVEVTAESFDVTNRWIAESADAEGAESLYVQLEAIVLRRLEEARQLGEDS